MTYTYALVPVSEETHSEIKAMLERSGYGHAIYKHEADGQEHIDMHGLALVVGPKCKLCGKVRLPYLEFCGAACSAKWEAGERPEEPDIEQGASAEVMENRVRNARRRIREQTGMREKLRLFLIAHGMAQHGHLGSDEGLDALEAILDGA